MSMDPEVRIAKTTYYVVLDTNVLVYQTKLLHTPIGRALQHLLVRSNTKLALPEVIELEAVKHAEKHASEELERAVKALRLLGTLIGSEITFRRPSVAFGNVASDRFRELASVVEHLPMTLPHAQRVMRRLVSGLPPSGFGDAAIWEACVDLTQVADVHLITKDGDFFGAGKGNQLAPQLLEEASALTHRLAVYRSIEDALKVLEPTAPPLDTMVFRDSAERAVRSDVDRVAGRHGLILGSSAEFSAEPFPTDKPNDLALALVLRFEATAHETDASEAINGFLRVTAKAMGHLDNHVVDEVYFDTIEFVDADGHLFENPYIRHVFAYASDIAILSDSSR